MISYHSGKLKILGKNVMNMELKTYSWLRTFIALNVLLAIIMPINHFLGSNYMYLAEPPEIDNPLVIGKWPYYLINLEFIVVTLFLLTYLLFKSKIKMS